MKHFLPHFVQIKNKSLSVGDHLNQWPPSHTVEHYTTGKKADRAFLYDLSIKSSEGDTLCTFI